MVRQDMHLAESLRQSMLRRYWRYMDPENDMYLIRKCSGVRQPVNARFIERLSMDNQEYNGSDAPDSVRTEVSFQIFAIAILSDIPFQA